LPRLAVVSVAAHRSQYLEDLFVFLIRLDHKNRRWYEAPKGPGGLMYARISRSQRWRRICAKTIESRTRLNLAIHTSHARDSFQGLRCKLAYPRPTGRSFVKDVVSASFHVQDGTQRVISLSLTSWASTALERFPPQLQSFTSFVRHRIVDSTKDRPASPKIPAAHPTKVL
jgi:hypothetical protein